MKVEERYTSKRLAVADGQKKYMRAMQRRPISEWDGECKCQGGKGSERKVDSSVKKHEGQKDGKAGRQRGKEAER